MTHWRRVEEFCGVMILAYAIISNHFYNFIYVPEPDIPGLKLALQAQQESAILRLVHKKVLVSIGCVA